MAGIEDLSPADLKAFHLGRELMKNPEIHRQGLRLAKQANPALHFTEIELEDKIAQVEDNAKEREKKLADELMAERVERRRAEKNREIIAAGFTPEEIEAIIVAEKCSYATAMKLAAAEKRSAEPTAGDYRGGTPPGTPVEMRPTEEWRKLGTNTGGLRKHSAQVAADMINQFRGRTAAR